MITTERFNTLIQEQAASGYLTPIDSERDLSEVRGGGGKVFVKVDVDLDTGKATISGGGGLSKKGYDFNFEYDGSHFKAGFEYDPAKAKNTPKSPVAPSGGTPNTPVIPAMPDDPVKPIDQAKKK